MKITEDTAHRFTVFSRRSYLADLCLLLFAGLGTVFTYAIAVGEFSQLTPLLLVISALFAGIGVWGLWYNGSAMATFDADRRMGQLRWRTAFGVKTRDFSFDDLRGVSVHEDDDMHTLQFDLAGASPVLFERAYSTNRKAVHVAAELQRWLDTHGRPSETT